MSLDTSNEANNVRTKWLLCCDAPLAKEHCHAYAMHHALRQYSDRRKWHDAQCRPLTTTHTHTHTTMHILNS